MQHARAATACHVEHSPGQGSATTGLPQRGTGSTSQLRGERGNMAAATGAPGQFRLTPKPAAAGGRPQPVASHHTKRRQVWLVSTSAAAGPPPPPPQSTWGPHHPGEGRRASPDAREGLGVRRSAPDSQGSAWQLAGRDSCPCGRCCRLDQPPGSISATSPRNFAPGPGTAPVQDLRPRDPLSPWSRLVYSTLSSLAPVSRCTRPISQRRRRVLPKLRCA